MSKKLARLVAYATNPVKTFVVRHPVWAVAMLASYLLLKRALKSD